MALIEKTETDSGKAAGTSFWKERAPLLYLAAAVFLLHAAVTGGHLQSPDEELLYRMAESMALAGTTAVLPLEADMATGLLPQGLHPSQTFATRPGHEPDIFFAQYLPLQPLLAVPLVWLAALLEGFLALPFARALWPTMTLDYLGSLPEEDFARAAFRRGLVVTLFGPIVSAATAVVLARLGRLLTGLRAPGIVLAVLYAFGTMAWPHARTFFTESLAAFWALLALEQLIRWHGKPIGGGARHAVLAGLFLALGNWTRVDGPFLTVGFVLGGAGLMAWKAFREEAWARTQAAFPWRDALALALVPLLAWVLLQQFNAWRFGEADLTAGYGHQAEGVAFGTPLLVGLHGFLASPGKGMFFFSPALLLGVWGWLRAPAGWNWLKALVLLGYLPFFVAMAKWQNWDGGWCWGPRHIVQVHLPVMLGAVFLFTGTVSRLTRGTMAAVLALGIGVQLYGSSQCALDYYREYFLNYGNEEYHQVNLRGMQEVAIREDFGIFTRGPEGRLGPEIPASRLPAPMIDSLYLPQHSQWWSYRRMWRLGYRDWYLWNAVSGAERPAPGGGLP